MPDLKLPNVDVEKAVTNFNNAVKEAAYVAVGLGVLGFQRAQVQRVELTKQLEEQFRNLPAAVKGPLEGYTQFAKEQAATARTTVNEQLTELSKTLEEAFAPVREQILNAVPTEVRGQIAEFAKAVDERIAPARAQIEEQIDQIEERLPAAARNLVQTVREAASTQEQALRTVVGL